MPVSKTFVEGNVRTEILDLREGVGEHRSIDEILSKTGGATGTYEEVGEDGPPGLLRLCDCLICGGDGRVERTDEVHDPPLLGKRRNTDANPAKF